MRTASPSSHEAATNGHGKNAAKSRRRNENGKSAADDGDWFARSARSLHPHKPGTVLFLVTGLGDERLCQRYASGEVRPPAYFLRALLRSDGGEQWMNAVMDGCTQSWWANLKSNAELGHKVRGLR
jgi:hypothetical protein